MIKTSILLFLIISTLSCSTIPEITETNIANKENLILNSGFELGKMEADALPLGWFTVTNDKDISWDTNVYRSGDRSIKITTSKESVEIVSESFPISPNNVYYLQCYVTSLKPLPSSVELVFMTFDKKGKKIDNYSELSFLEESWTKIDFRTGFLNDHSRFARVIVILPNEVGSVFWIDDVECYVAHSFTK